MQSARVMGVGGRWTVDRCVIRPDGGVKEEGEKGGLCRRRCGGWRQKTGGGWSVGARRRVECRGKEEGVV